jgi:hypothetical protein
METPKFENDINKIKVITNINKMRAFIGVPAQDVDTLMIQTYEQLFTVQSYTMIHYTRAARATRLNNAGGAWGFVELYFPKYSCSDLIARNNDLQKILDHDFELGDCAENLLNNEFKGNLTDPAIKTELYDTERTIYEMAIENYLTTLENPAPSSFLLEERIKQLEDQLTHSVTWSVEDFEGIANSQEDPNIYDPLKFESALLRMINNHDSGYGITWNTIDFYLFEYCLKD